MRYRLRYLSHDLELTEGVFAVGRSTSCQLSLDDPLVSRRHALLEVTHRGVTLEDLQSRNGVLVNDTRIEGKIPLAVGDRILIGSQELVLLAGEAGASASAAGLGRMTLPKMQSPLHRGALDAAVAERNAQRGNAAVDLAPSASASERRGPTGHSTVSTVGSVVSSLSALEGDAEPSMVRRADQFKLLGGVAEKAFALGRAAEAERLLASALAEVIEASRAGRMLPATLVDQAARYSAKLATATGKGGWADYVVELYLAQERLCPAPVIDELYNAMRKITAVDLQTLRAYLAALRQASARFGPAERFLLQRLEGLERIAALK